MIKSLEVYACLSVDAKAKIREAYKSKYGRAASTFYGYVRYRQCPADVEAWLIDELEALGLAPDGTPVKRKSQAAA